MILLLVRISPDDPSPNQTPERAAAVSDALGGRYRSLLSLTRSRTPAVNQPVYQ